MIVCVWESHGYLAPLVRTVWVKAETQRGRPVGKLVIIQQRDELGLKQNPQLGHERQIDLDYYFFV